MSLETPATIEAVSPNAPRYATPLAYAISCFFIWGLAYGLLDVLNKHFQETLHVGKAQSAWLQIAYFGAYLTMSIPAGILLHRKGYKFGLVTGLVVTALGAFCFIPSSQVAAFPAFVAAMFVIAAGLCFLETAADTYVNVLGHPDHAPHRLNLAQSFNALGVFLGPIIGGSLFFGGAASETLGGAEKAVPVIYAVIGVLVLIYALVLSRTYLPEVHESEHVADDESRTPKTLFSQRHFVLGVITQIFYIGAQVGSAAFFINLATDTWHGLSSQEGAYLLSLAMAGYLVGRFVTTGLLLKFSPRAVLILYGLINTALCLIASAGIERASAIALACTFFFMGTMFPTIFALGVANLGAHTKRASSAMVMAIGLGGVLFPYPMGMIADRYGTPFAYVLPAACFLLVALYGAKGAIPGARNA